MKKVIRKIQYLIRPVFYRVLTYAECSGFGTAAGAPGSAGQFGLEASGMVRACSEGGAPKIVAAARDCHRSGEGERDS